MMRFRQTSQPTQWMTPASTLVRKSIGLFSLYMVRFWDTLPFRKGTSAESGAVTVCSPSLAPRKNRLPQATKESALVTDHAFRGTTAPVFVCSVPDVRQAPGRPSPSPSAAIAAAS